MIGMTIHKDPQSREEKCHMHGIFRSYCYVGGIWTKCPQCSEEKDTKEKQAEDEKKAADAAREWQTKIGKACIPERFMDRRIESFEARTAKQRAALDFATRYADNFDVVLRNGECALFVGTPGTGKTHLAVGIAMRIMERDKRIVLFTTVLRALRMVKDTWHKDSEKTEAQIVQSLVFPDLLILDEVGVQFGSETEKLILFDVLNERYEKRKPTIFLSNQSVDGVRSYLGDRLWDRIREDGGECIVFDWDSHRGKA